MFNLEKLVQLLENYAPLELSRKMIEKGDYDNSGVIVNNHDYVKGVLFTLDLTEIAVDKALELGCDTIITHHPAIYNPIKSLGETQDTFALLKAVKSNLNVLSMHLNLDVADCGIDFELAKGLGAKQTHILDYLDETHGYGREFSVEKIALDEFVKKVEKVFGSDKIIAYGCENVCKIASFCGGGSSHALSEVANKTTNADTIVTSDIPHHVLLALVNMKRNVIILPHYVSENYGFNKFYACVAGQLPKDVKAHYFTDKRFM